MRDATGTDVYGRALRKQTNVSSRGSRYFVLPEKYICGGASPSLVRFESETPISITRVYTVAGSSGTQRTEYATLLSLDSYRTE